MALSRTRQAGFSIVEVVISTALFGLMVMGVMGLYFYSSESAFIGSDRTRALLLAEEGMEAVKDIRDTGFRNLVDGTHGVQIAPGQWSFGQWSFSGTSTSIGKFTRSITISSVPNEAGKLISSIVSWIDAHGKSRQISLATYMSFWLLRSWLDTTVDNFNAGTHQETITATAGDGQVQLGSLVYADWCNPTITMTSVDLPGNGLPQSIYSIPGQLYMGAAWSSSGYSFLHANITSDNPPVANMIGTFDGYITNDVFAEGNYAYIATTSDNAEVVIINISSTPYTQVGYFNASGTTDAQGIYVSGNRGYVLQGNALRVFDLTSKSGSRSVLGSITLAGNGRSITVIGSYAYIAIDSSSTQMQIVNISNPASMFVTGQVRLSAGSGRDVSMSPDGNRAYLVTSWNLFYPEFFVINTSAKTGNRPSLGSAQSFWSSPLSVFFATDNRVIVVGGGFFEQYQIYNISSEGSPSRCGELTIPDILTYDVAGVRDFNGNTFTYILTSSYSSELRVIRGGPGGGGLNGFGYPSSGTFTSRVFDTEQSSYFYNLSWTRQLPSGTNLRFRVRTSDNPAFTGSQWYGPDGTTGTYFTTQTGQLLPSIVQNKRYIQYRAYFTSDTISTPILEDVRIQYE